MFCQHCGTQLQPGRSNCRACGKALSGYASQSLARHVYLLGIFWIAYSAFSLAAGAAVTIVANVVFHPVTGTEAGAPAFVYPLLSVVGMLLLVKAIAGIGAGYGLIHHESWARVLALVLGFVDLLHAPLGTILGVYTVAALLSSNAKREYGALPQPA